MPSDSTHPVSTPPGTPGLGAGGDTDARCGAGCRGGGPGGADRLNLLLTFGGWQRDSWADRLPRVLEPIGVRSLRAHTAREAADLIRSYPIHIAVVDLRLPFDAIPPSSPVAPGAQAMAAALEEAGTRVLDLLSRLASPPPTIVIKRGRSTREDAREMQHALRIGACAALDPPVHIEDMLRALQRTLHRFYGGQWPGLGAPGSSPPGSSPASPMI